MTRLMTHSVAQHPSAALLDPVAVGRWLADAGLDWPDGATPSEVQIERVWPARGNGLAFEWSFTLGGAKRWSLFGRVGSQGWSGSDAPSNRVALTPDGIRGVQTLVTSGAVRIHTPDLDPDLPQLGRCLDGSEMADALRPHLFGSSSAGPVRTSRIRARLLSYRAGRRAAIAYQAPRAVGAGHRLLGKTYRDGRGETMLRRLATLGPQLETASNGRVRVPAPIAYLPEQRMLLFSWCEGAAGRSVSERPARILRSAPAGMDALAALHRVPTDGLAAFSVADELAVVDRWDAALQVCDHEWSDAARTVAASLHGAARDVQVNSECTIHRDFYERQYVVGREATTLLDLDTLARGDAAVDIGNFLAHLWLAALVSGEPTAGFSAQAGRLIRRYLASGGSLDRSSLRFYWASALFRVGAVHAFRSATREHAPAMWRLAAAVLEPPGTGRDIGCVHVKAEGITSGDPGLVLRETQP